MAKITVAKSAGFCFGVNRAVDIVEKLIAEGKSATTLGPIIHNPQLVDKLKSQGVIPVNSPEEADPDSVMVIRSHGIGQSVYDRLKELSLFYLDATCPFVSKIHHIVEQESEKGQYILVAGDSEHPEVIGIMDYIKGSGSVFKNEEELLEIFENLPKDEIKGISLVAQTTFHKETFEKSTKTLKKHYTNAVIFDTICNATSKRQKEAAELAQKSDIMLVIGGKKSSNTLKLAEISEKHCKTLLIETADELKKEDFAGAQQIGITAGASTPAYIIREVYQTMSEILLENNNEEFNFEQELEKSFKRVKRGDRVKAIVTSVSPTEISVDLGTKHAGYVALSELTSDPELKTSDVVKVDDEIELMVIKTDDQEGTVQLSRTRIEEYENIDKIMNAAGTDEIFEGTVVEVLEKGVVVNVSGVKIFVPASHATLRRNDPLNELARKKVRLKILESNRGRRRAVGSIRLVLQDERKATEEAAYAAIEPGQVYKGEVKSITPFGAFVEVCGVDGLVHISELSWKKIKHPSEVVSMGQVLEVYVKDIDKENKKISLGYRKAEDNPFEIFKAKYQVGDIVAVKVASIVSYGAFATIIPEVDGLIHISQLADYRVEKVADILKVGMEVNAKIIDINPESKRISLSIRALEEKPEAGEESEQSPIAEQTEEQPAKTRAEGTEEAAE